MEKEDRVQEDVAARMLYLMPKEILTFKEACLYLGRSSSSMYKLTSGRLIPYYVPNGKLIYFKRTELEEWVLQNKRKSKDEIEHDLERFLKSEKIKGLKIDKTKNSYTTVAVFRFVNSSFNRFNLVQIKKHLRILHCKCLIIKLPKLDSNQRPSD